MNARVWPEEVEFIPGFPQPGDNEKEVKTILQDTLTIIQNGKCPVCRESLSGIIDLHEGLISKGDIQGWPKRWKVVIFNVMNCILVHRMCHISWPNRDKIYTYKCNHFGKYRVDKWYYSLPLKRKLKRLIYIQEESGD